MHEVDPIREDAMESNTQNQDLCAIMPVLFYSYTIDIDIAARWETDRELGRYELPFGKHVLSVSRWWRSMPLLSKT